jgi:hypothetical protein
MCSEPGGVSLAHDALNGRGQGVDLSRIEFSLRPFRQHMKAPTQLEDGSAQRGPTAVDTAHQSVTYDCMPGATKQVRIQAHFCHPANSVNTQLADSMRLPWASNTEVLSTGFPRSRDSASEGDAAKNQIRPPSVQASQALSLERCRSANSFNVVGN